ncbi:MAG: hypothetical protein EOO20_25355, partial [Chryseobacterium sp.]
MNNEILYVPIFRAKEGELVAISKLEKDAKDRILPLIDLYAPAIGNKHPIEVHLKKFFTKIERYWQSREFIVDTSGLDPNTQIEGKHHLIWVINTLSEMGLNFYICTPLSKNMPYQNSILEMVSRGAIKNIFVRVHREDLETVDDLNSELSRHISTLNLSSINCILLFDLKHIADEKSLEDMIEILSTCLPECQLPHWKRVVVAGSSFPVDVSKIKPNSQERIPRLELKLWNSMLAIEPLI